MKVTILGMEASKGTSQKSGKPYDMGRIFTVARLAPSMGDGIAKGSMGLEIQTENSDTVRRIAHLPMPLEAECDIQTVMRFGKAEQMCFDIKPISPVK